VEVEEVGALFYLLILDIGGQVKDFRKIDAPGDFLPNRIMAEALELYRQ